MSAAKKKSVQRSIRWVRVDDEGHVVWNQLKSATLDEDGVIDVPTDRQINFTTTEPNPDYIPPEDRKGKKKIKSEQANPMVQVYKHPKRIRDAVSTRGQKIIDLLADMKNLDVTEAVYSLETGKVKFTHIVKVDGTKVERQRETDDETIIAAFDDLIKFLVKTVSTKAKPVGFFEPATRG